MNPFHSPYTPFANYAHLFVDYEKTFGDCTDFYVDYAHNYDDYVNTANDHMNIAYDSANTPSISFVDFCIPNPMLLQLLFFRKSKIKIMFIAIYVIFFYLHHSSFVVSVVDILHRLPLCQKFCLLTPPALFSQYIDIFCYFFLNFRFHVFIKIELIHVDQHRVRFKLLNGH